MNYMNVLTKNYLKKVGYSRTEIYSYFQHLASLREKINPKVNLASLSEEKYLKTDDGNLIFFQVWKPELPGKCKKIIICQHGHNVPGDLFFPFADFFSHDSIIVSIDNRGHGRSGPKRGDYDDYEMSLQCFDSLIKSYHLKYPTLSIFLIGESLGSALILHYLSKEHAHKSIVSGAILISTPIRLSVMRPIKRSRLLYLILIVLLSFLGVITNHSLIIKWPQDYNNPTYLDEFNEYDIHDLIKRRTLTFRSVKTLLRVLVPLEYTIRNVSKPLLILQGTGDGILDPIGSKVLFNNVRSKIKKLVYFKNANHSLFMDKNAQDMYGIIDEWINSFL